MEQASTAKKLVAVPVPRQAHLTPDPDRPEADLLGQDGNGEVDIEEIKWGETSLTSHTPRRRYRILKIA